MFPNQITQCFISLKLLTAPSTLELPLTGGNICLPGPHIPLVELEPSPRRSSSALCDTEGGAAESFFDAALSPSVEGLASFMFDGSISGGSFSVTILFAPLCVHLSGKNSLMI